MSVHQLPNGRWQTRWRDDQNKQRSKNFRRKVDADRLDRTVHTDLERGTYVAPAAGKTTVTEWADRWLSIARSLGDGGRETYQRDLARHILPVLGDYPLARLTDELIDDYLTARIDAGAAPSSVHREYRTINRMLNVAVERNKLPRNPCAPVEPPKIPETEMRFLTALEVEALAGKIGDRYGALVLVLAYSGIRWSEAVGLQSRRLVGDTIVVADQLIRRADKQWHRDPPKSAAGRRAITLPPFVLAELETHLTKFAQPGPEGLVFPNSGGRPLSGPSWRGNVFLPACGKAGLATAAVGPDEKPLVPTKWEGAPRVHDLRHTHAALLVLAGAHPKAMQVRMGHSSIRTTLGKYGHLYPEMDETIAANLETIRATTIELSTSTAESASSEAA